MSGKLILSTSLVFVLGLIGTTRADFETVGVYDPDDAPHHNQVDQSGVYDSHTGNAGPENIIDLATFQEFIGPAFEADAGGVISGESPGDSLGSDDVVVAKFGANSTKSVSFTHSGGNLSFGSGGGSGNRLPISGDHRFGKGSATADFNFSVGLVSGGEPDEVITFFAATLLERDNRATVPVVTATFSDGSTVTATADMIGDDNSPNDKDTFFCFMAPKGTGIVSVEFQMNQWVHLDELAFITSAYAVVSENASDPNPADEATDVPRDVVLSWTPGELASPVNGHKIYFSENFDEVNNGIGGITLSTNSYAPPQRLDFGKTYYWRVDEISAPPDSTVFQGDIWSFTTEPVGYPVANITATASSSMPGQGPENAVNGSGLTDNLHGIVPETMWLSAFGGPQPTWIQFEFDKVYKLHEMLVWNSNTQFETGIGYGARDVSIEYSVDGIDYMTLGTTHEFNRAPGQPDYAHNTVIDMGGLTAKFVRLTVNTNWAVFPLEQYGLSEVRFLYIPIQAREPYPESGATDVGPDVTLGWRAGREAAEHKVYVSTDEQSVIDGTVAAVTVTEPAYAPSLVLDSTYFWRIDEVNDAETPTMLPGDVWNFTTQEFIVVDDFEAYNDILAGEEGSNLVYVAWIDGYVEPPQVRTNGSTMGYLTGTSMETNIVNSGDQSAPVEFDNTAASISEVTRTFSPAQDWTQYGITTLSLFVYEASDNVGGDVYVKINGIKVPLVDESTYPPGFNPGWVQYNVDLTAMNVSNVRTLTIGVDGANAQGLIFVDDIRLYREAPDLVAVKYLPPIIEAESGIITAPFEILSNIPGASGGQYIMAPNGGGNSSDAPATADDGWATYTINVPADGDYVIGFRGLRQVAGSGGDDSFWVRIPDSVLGHVPYQPPDWIRCGGLFPGDAQDIMVWDFVRDWFSGAPDVDPVVFTLTAGQHELQISRREDGTALDAIAIFVVE
ncbi:MAG: discoidin domain-containing protein [Planctomycetota bacterium]|jgi:hypothetical protein